jgi:transcriptional regulator with XRE-family HTH domain
LTQEAAAELAGVAHKYYQDIEAGRRPSLRLDTLIRLSKPYSLGPGDILQARLPSSKITSRRKVQKRQRAPSRAAEKRAQ